MCYRLETLERSPMKFRSVAKSEKNEMQKVGDKQGEFWIGCLEFYQPTFCVVATWHNDEGQLKGCPLTDNFESQQMVSEAFNTGVESRGTVDVENFILRAQSEGIVEVLDA
jgi:hypothetical protein